MGLIQHHTLQDYWATDEVLSTPFFATVMKRNRFFASVIISTLQQ